MRLHKAVNRVHEGTTYYRWIVSIPPRAIRELGWTDGQLLEATIRGNVLWIGPLIGARPKRRAPAAPSDEETVRLRTPSLR